ncbi:efflux transporter, outer membrane factor (OMF) lipoprotein, NodT family [Paraburkholderia phenazinium]|uniref:Efflux transporter, outer membrane factor (OMF) lipoprotein, NodT family n=1 Tax=Paraburkholderia phenazinium TaxID=60549 RepID=A0A1N6HI18_9BURK|nr:efflux transporter, outer membrane factor (OMF) lipoprotein, NodT family [Paraburkholderia phenazinium]
MKSDLRTLDSAYEEITHSRSRRAAKGALALVVATSLAACMVGPDYRKPALQVPEGFKEGVDWQRAEVNPQAAISSTWWRMYGDDQLNGLVEQALRANQSIASAEAAYRVALATVESSRASLFPVVTAGLSGARSGGNLAGLEGSGTSSTSVPASNSVIASGTVSWELDLWGEVRREVEEAKANAEASDAQLAGERISIAASVATDYFQLRQADYDIRALQEQQDIYGRILVMTQTGLKEGFASNDDVLNAQENLQTVIADLQTTETTREQDEHAIAVLTGTPPESFSIAPDPDYRFPSPDVPPALPSQLLERRYDVVSAERTAAGANASIGVAEAAYFPTLTLSAEGGFAHNTFAQLFTVPSRFWTLGPALAGTIFDGGERTAAVHKARATYDEDVATYRNTVLTAFQSVEDSLSSMNHLRAQEEAFARVLDSSSRLFASQQAQFNAGASSQQNVLTQRLTLIQAQESVRDTQALLAESNVTLVKNLGGGWQGNDAEMASAPAAASSPASKTATQPVPARSAD